MESQIQRLQVLLLGQRSRRHQHAGDRVVVHELPSGPGDLVQRADLSPDRQVDEGRHGIEDIGRDFGDFTSFDPQLADLVQVIYMSRV